MPVERAQQHVPQPRGRRVLRKQQLAAARACNKRVGAQILSLGAAREGLAGGFEGAGATA